MSREESDSEEEILVYAEFEDNVNIKKYRSVHVLGVNDKAPIIQMDDTFFIGKHESSLGTYMFFEEDPTVESEDPLFDKLPDKSLKYVCKTRKHLNMEHAYVTPREGKEQLPDGEKKRIDDDVKPMTFSTLQQATDTFSSYFKEVQKPISEMKD